MRAKNSGFLKKGERKKRWIFLPCLFVIRCRQKYSHLRVICGVSLYSQTSRTMNFTAPEGRPGGDSVTILKSIRDLRINKLIQNRKEASYRITPDMHPVHHGSSSGLVPISRRRKNVYLLSHWYPAGTPGQIIISGSAFIYSLQTVVA
jgi:hypothetical protein